MILFEDHLYDGGFQETNRWLFKSTDGIVVFAVGIESGAGNEFIGLDQADDQLFSVMSLEVDLCQANIEWHDMGIGWILFKYDLTRLIKDFMPVAVHQFEFLFRQVFECFCIKRAS